MVSPEQVRDGFLEPSSLLAYARKAYSKVFKRVPSLSGLRPVEGRFRCRATVVSGWSLKENKRKPLRSALDAGCVMEYAISAEREGPLREALAALELLGLGKQRSGGYGQVAIEGVVGGM